MGYFKAIFYNGDVEDIEIFSEESLFVAAEAARFRAEILGTTVKRVVSISQEEAQNIKIGR